MGKHLVRNVIFVLLLSIAVFSMFKYWSQLRENSLLQESLTQAQGQVLTLEQEKETLVQGLKQEKASNAQLLKKTTYMKGYLKASKNRMSRFFQDDLKLQKNLEETKSKFSILEAENQSLVESQKRMALENDEFKLKLSSIPELKKAIKELRVKNRKVPIPTVDGNRGFLVKDGQLMTREKIKIEVVPAQTKE